MRNDFCISDRRSSLSVLLVTLNASNKSFGRRQESSSEGIFLLVCTAEGKKKTGIILKVPCADNLKCCEGSLGRFDANNTSMCLSDETQTSAALAPPQLASSKLML